MSDHPADHAAAFGSKPKRQRVVSNRVREAQQREQEARESADQDANELCLLEQAAGIPPIPRNFEYGDHTADIIFHGYGQTAEQTFESITYAMISYMFDFPEKTPINPALTHTIHIEAQDIPELVFRYLTEILVQSINYYDELPSSMKKQIKKEPDYPGMIPRLVRVLKFSEEMVTAPAPPPYQASAAATATASTPAQPQASPVGEKAIVKAQLCTAEDDEPVQNAAASAPTSPATSPALLSYKKYILDVEIQGDFIDTVRLGAGTEVKAITRELTCLKTVSDPQVKKQKGNFHLQVLVDI